MAPVFEKLSTGLSFNSSSLKNKLKKFDTGEPEISPFLLHTFFFLSEPVAYITHDAT